MSDIPERIVFAGTPDFALPPLQALIETGRAPVAVLTQPDRPAGRGRRLQPGPVKRLASNHGIRVLQPETLKADSARRAVRDLRPDLMVVVAYGLLLPPDVLDLPSLGCWNVHASLLPRWRGAAPVQRAIEAGDEETGVCIMQMDAGLDTGPVLHCLKTAIQRDETAGSLHDRLARLGARALTDCLDMAERADLPRAREQDPDDVTYAPRITKDEACLDWTCSARQLERRVRAFNPWPVAWFDSPHGRLRVWRAIALDMRHYAGAGDIIAAGRDGIDVATGRGVLRILEVQGEGGRRMAAADYLNAHPLT